MRRSPRTEYCPSPPHLHERAEADVAVGFQPGEYLLTQQPLSSQQDEDLGERTGEA